VKPNEPLPISYDAAWELVGGLSRPSKMPCYAWGIPASLCNVGSALRAIRGSTCEKCYALKGRYQFNRTQNALWRRYQGLYHPLWTDAMVRLIEGEAYFRWFDSGDLQSYWHLERITAIAKRLPATRFWLPTREQEYVHRLEDCPHNLLIRVSAPMVDGPPPREFEWTSTVVKDEPSCPSKHQDNRCGACRACWDRDVKNVSYALH
jgi:hypothetical protein